MEVVNSGAHSEEDVDTSDARRRMENRRRAQERSREFWRPQDRDIYKDWDEKHRS
jgi:hypothetical protein